MKSQNYENPSPDSAELLAIDERITSQLEMRAAITARRRTLAEPTYKTVVANPTQMHHKITLGAVLANEGLSAADANALAGLMGFRAKDFSERFNRMALRYPDARASTVMMHMIDEMPAELAAMGLYDEWTRRLTAYQIDREEWLKRDSVFRLEGAWRALDMTTDQQWLVRVTCRIRRIDLPGHLTRGDAANWLEVNGANLNYREFVL